VEESLQSSHKAGAEIAPTMTRNSLWELGQLNKLCTDHAKSLGCHQVQSSIVFIIKLYVVIGKAMCPDNAWVNNIMLTKKPGLSPSTRIKIDRGSSHIVPKS